MVVQKTLHLPHPRTKDNQGSSVLCNCQPSLSCPVFYLFPLPCFPHSASACTTALGLPADAALPGSPPPLRLCLRPRPLNAGTLAICCLDGQAQAQAQAQIPSPTNARLAVSHAPAGFPLKQRSDPVIVIFTQFATPLPSYSIRSSIFLRTFLLRRPFPPYLPYSSHRHLHTIHTTRASRVPGPCVPPPFLHLMFWRPTLPGLPIYLPNDSSPFATTRRAQPSPHWCCIVALLPVRHSPRRCHHPAISSEILLWAVTEIPQAR